jgi:hypothetical protein
MSLQPYKIFDQEILYENFLFKPIHEEIILQPYKIFHQKYLMKKFVATCLRGKDLATIKYFRPKNVYENFWFKPISAEMILQP